MSDVDNTSRLPQSANRYPALLASTWLAVAAVTLIVAAAGYGLVLVGGSATLAFACFACVAAVVVARIGGHHPHFRFGEANAVTLLRAAGASALLGLAPAAPLSPAVAWTAFAAATAILALDGIDGWLARRAATVSQFGARFDMETDALLMLVLSLLATLQGKAGAWILLIGLMRYGFVAAARVVRALGRELPPSWRRKAVCVVQMAVLAALLAPPVAPPLSTLAAGIALLLLAWSFLLDIAWLMRAGAAAE